MTKGTFFDLDRISYEQRFIICIQSKNNYRISIVLIESTTSRIIVGNFDDSQGYNKLKKLLSETKPLEVVYNNETLND